MEKYLLQCKISLITISSTGVIGITMGGRSLYYFYSPFSGSAIDVCKYPQPDPDPEEITFPEGIVFPKQKQKKRKGK